MFRFLLLTIFFSLIALVAALPVARDVWVPPITSPTSSTTWYLGGTYTVTWDTSTKPSQVTNPNGEIYLRVNGETLLSEPLAEGFLLTAGTVDVTIPSDITPADDWEVVLFGDSGNFSPPFSILAPSS